MSVKIYDGLMIERDLTLADARLMAGKLRARLDKLAESEQIEACARTALRNYDHAYFGLSGNGREEQGGSPLGVALEMLRSERENDERGLRSFLPLGAQMCLFPLGNGRTLAMCYGAKIYKEAFKKIAKAKDYGYWDNTDPLEDLPKGEWARRERDWKKALGRDFEATPAEAGLTAEIVSSKYKTWWTPEPAQMIEALEGEEFCSHARSVRLAKEVLESKWVSAAEPKTGSQAYRTMESFKAWIEGAGSASFEALRALYQSELPGIDQQALRLPSGEIQALGAGSRARLEAAVLAEAALPSLEAKARRLAL